jgi:pimeloyl-ACP methyl ester carboxylesterase
MSRVAKVVYGLTQAGQRRSLQTGGNGWCIQEVEVDVSDELFEHCWITADGGPVFSAVQNLVVGTGGLFVTEIPDMPASRRVPMATSEEKFLDSPIDPADVSTVALAWARDREEADRKARLEFVSDIRALLRIKDGEPATVISRSGGSITEVALEVGGKDGRRVRLASLVQMATQTGGSPAEVRTVWEDMIGARRTAARVAFTSRRETSADLEWLPADEVERLRSSRRYGDAVAWVAQFGSRRLKIADEMDLLHDSMGVYCDERLAFEMPGWRWAEANAKEQVWINPTEAQLVALQEARAAMPDLNVDLVSMAGVEAGAAPWIPALSAMIPWNLDRIAFKRL